MPHCGQFSQKLVHSLALTIVHSEYFKEYWRHHISIQAHNSVSWSTFGSDSSLFGYDATSFVLVDFGIFCYFPGFRSGLWLGHSKIVVKSLVFSRLCWSSCWKLNLWSNLISLYFVLFTFPFNLPVPDTMKHCAWFPSTHDDWMQFIRPDNLVSHRCFFEKSKRACIYWGQASVWPIWHIPQISEVLLWVSHLHTWSPGSYLTSLSILTAQFGQVTSSMKSSGCSKHLPLRIMDPTVLLGTFSEADVFVAFPVWQRWLWDLQEVPVTSWLVFWIWLVYYTDRFDHLKKMPRMDSIQCVEPSQRWSRDMGCTLATFFKYRSKGSEYLCQCHN